MTTDQSLHYPVGPVPGAGLRKIQAARALRINSLPRPAQSSRNRCTPPQVTASPPMIKLPTLGPAQRISGVLCARRSPWGPKFGEASQIQANLIAVIATRWDHPPAA